MWLVLVLEVEGAVENEITRQIVDAAIHIHRTLGPGLLESACPHILAHALRKRGLAVGCEVSLPLR
ncbi:MAG: GxxExxY protein [Phycisphaerales bacterium]|nr:GxxExxY protein [Phycisphaerales bacterium]